MAVSACGTPTPPTPMPTPDVPILSHANVGAIVMSYSKQMPTVNWDGCVDNTSASGDSIEYKGRGKWVVTVGNCSFVVDDATGKVTAP